jgi:hypothetical protein
MRRKSTSMDNAVRGTRILAAIALVGGICACIAGGVTGEAVPIVLGAVGAAGGAVLAVLVFLTRRKTRS